MKSAGRTWCRFGPGEDRFNRDVRTTEGAYLSAVQVLFRQCGARSDIVRNQTNPDQAGQLSTGG